MAVIITFTCLHCAKNPPISPVNVTNEGVAIKEYDPVAYFTDKKPVKGSGDFEFVWHGAGWNLQAQHTVKSFKKTLSSSLRDTAAIAPMR